MRPGGYRTQRYPAPAPEDRGETTDRLEARRESQSDWLDSCDQADAAIHEDDEALPARRRLRTHGDLVYEVALSVEIARKLEGRAGLLRRSHPSVWVADSRLFGVKDPLPDRRRRALEADGALRTHQLQDALRDLPVSGGGAFAAAVAAACDRRDLRDIGGLTVAQAEAVGRIRYGPPLHVVFSASGTDPVLLSAAAAVSRRGSGDPHQSARVYFPAGAGKRTRFVLEQVHGDAYMRGMHDHQRGFHEESVWKDAARVSPEAILRVEAELKTVLREMGAAGYDRGYGDAAAGRNNAPRRSAHGPSDRGPGDAVEYLHRDARPCHRGWDDHFRGVSREDAASRRLRVDYVREVTAIGEDRRAALRCGPRRGRTGDPQRPRAVPAAADSPQADRGAALRDLGRSRQAIDRAAVGERRRDAGPSR